MDVITLLWVLILIRLCLYCIKHFSGTAISEQVKVLITIIVTILIELWLWSRIGLEQIGKGG